jgi:death-on-curing protein
LKASLEDWLNLEINVSVDEQERVVLAIASGELGREAFVEWLQRNTTAS